MKNKLLESYFNIPNNIICKIDDNVLMIKGSLGYLKMKINKFLGAKFIKNNLLIYSKTYIKNRKNIKSLIITTISLLKNMIIGVTSGYIKHLVLFGIGYKVELNGNNIKLNLGYSHNIIYHVPNNIDVICKNNTEIIIKGINKQLVGQVASDIRKYKIPDPYKGKGIRYLNEKLILKESKKVK